MSQSTLRVTSRQTILDCLALCRNSPSQLNEQLELRLLWLLYFHHSLAFSPLDFQRWELLRSQHRARGLHLRRALEVDSNSEHDPG